MALTKVPSRTLLVDGQFIQVEGPDQIISGFQYDAQQRAFYAKESQVIYPSTHGLTHITEDPIPSATCDSPGLMSADDKCKVDALVQTMIGVLGFQGSGFPDDGGWMSGQIVFAAGSEFISLERIGNVIRFTVNSPIPFANNCDNQIPLNWVQDESETSSIRPPTCSGKLPGVNSYGEFKVYLYPQSTIVNPASVTSALANKGRYPAFIFKRYDDSIAPGTAEYEMVLKRNQSNESVTEIGEAFTPGASGIPEKVWFMGLDDDGNLIRFDLDPELTPGLLGGLLYNGHLITKKMAVIVDYAPTVLTNNQYRCRMWDVTGAEAIGDTFVATNTWRYVNPESTPSSLSSPQALALDVSSDVLPIGTLVDIWRFQIGEISGDPVYRYFFNKQPAGNPANYWTMVGAVEFGEIVEVRDETDDDGGSAGKSAYYSSKSVDDFENTIWGLTGRDIPVMTFQDVAVFGTEEAVLNTEHRATISTELPGLTVEADPGTEPFSQRPVILWNRTGLDSSILLRAEVGRPEDSAFTPYDILLHAPIDSYGDAYMKVIGIGTINDTNYIKVKGISYGDIPRRGSVRVISSNHRNKIFNYGNKLLFPTGDDDSIVLMATADNTPYPGAVGDILELLHAEYSAPCARLEFTNDEDGTIKLQVKVGILGMDVPYELDEADDLADDFVRGLRAGYTVSAEYTQELSWTGVGTQPSSSVDGFYIYDGGIASDDAEYWNILEMMLRGDQLWVWWNGLLVPPSQSLSEALPTPVSVSTPYFPLSTGRTHGKFGMRLWPGAKVRRLSLRTQPRSFSEYLYGQLTLG